MKRYSYLYFNDKRIYFYFGNELLCKASGELAERCLNYIDGNPACVRQQVIASLVRSIKAHKKALSN